MSVLHRFVDGPDVAAPYGMQQSIEEVVADALKYVSSVGRTHRSVSSTNVRLVRYVLFALPCDTLGYRRWGRGRVLRYEAAWVLDSLFVSLPISIWRFIDRSFSALLPGFL